MILAVGVKPDTRLAREAGLEIGPTGGIRVDDQMRTSDPAYFRGGRCRRGSRFRHRPAGLDPAGRAGQSPGPHRRRRDLRPRRPFPRLARHGRGRRLRPDPGHDRGERKIAPPGRHPLREVVHPFAAPRLVLSRRRAHLVEAAVLARFGPRARLPRPWAGQAWKNAST